MKIKNIISRLREILIYILKDIPIILLLEVWSIARVLSIALSVIMIVISGFVRNNPDACILTIFR
jgi:hypothetical protein